MSKKNIPHVIKELEESLKNLLEVEEEKKDFQQPYETITVQIMLVKDRISKLKGEME